MLRKAFVSVLCLIVGTAGAAPAPRTFAQIVATPRLAHSIIAGEVYDLDTHKVLYARNAQLLMKGASTTKLVTEGTSLALFGPNFRWTTPVYKVGSVDANGHLTGDVVLVASGDPNISQRIQPDGTLAFENEDHAYDGSPDTKAVPGDPLAVLRQLAVQVKQAGITEIDGSVRIDSSLFPNEGPEFGTQTTVAPMVLNDNVIDVTLTPGAKPGDTPQMHVSPQTPFATFVNGATTGKAGSEPTIDLSNDKKQPDGSHLVTITGAIPAGKPILFAYRVADPDAFAQAAFQLALQDAGVTVKAPPNAPAFDPAAAKAQYTPANLLAKHVSPPLIDDVYVTLKVSDNLHAALMPYEWAAYEQPRPKGDLLVAGFAREAKLLHSLGLSLAEGSQQDGPGGHVYWTPDFMVHFLAWAHAQPWAAAYYRALPILGVDGTLWNIQTHSPAKGKVHAKTGTDGDADYLLGQFGEVVTAKGLAGYMTTRSGHHVAFAFYVNRITGVASIYNAKDIVYYTGQIEGELANAAYWYL